MNDALAPVILQETSVTERAEFRQCRRKWFLSTVHRLQTRGGASYFWFGTGGHYALEHYYLTLQKDPKAIDAAENKARRAFDRYVRTTMPDVEKDFGFLWEQAKPEYDDLAAKGRSMLEGYFQMERETGGMGRVVAVEERYRVQIINERGRPIKGAWISGRFDLVIERPDGSLWVVDHKFLGSKHNSAYLDIDDQLTGYAYVWARATGSMPRGEVYNVLLKKMPGPPLLLKSGKLSVDKSQATTYSHYRQAIRDNGLNVADYSDILTYLKGRGWQDFYLQEGVFRNIRQLQEFERNLLHEWRDMRRVAANPEQAYPSPSSFNCPGCSVKLICQTMQDRGDVDAIIEAQFVVGPERK